MEKNHLWKTVSQCVWFGKPPQSMWTISALEIFSHDVLYVHVLTSMVWIESKTIASDFFFCRVFVISKKDGKMQSFRHANDFPKKGKIWRTFGLLDHGLTEMIGQDGNLSAVHSMIIYSNATVTSNRDRLFLIDLSESIFVPSIITNNITQEY